MSECCGCGEPVPPLPAELVAALQRVAPAGGEAVIKRHCDGCGKLWHDVVAIPAAKKCVDGAGKCGYFKR